MKTPVILTVLLLGLCISNVSAQYYDDSDYYLEGVEGVNYYDENEIPQDSVEIDSKTVPRGIKMWKIESLFGNIRPFEVDTLMHNFQNLNLTDGINGEYNFLGNLGSPRLSRIFFHRKDPSQFIFTDPYDYFLVPIDEFRFTNTLAPFSNLSYYTAGDQTDGEDFFRSLFTVNVNRRLNFGFTFDYLYGRGMYNYQSTSLFNTTLYSSYLGDRYNLHFIFSKNHMKMSENGGIEDDTYITTPEDLPNTYDPSDIPTVLNETWNRNDNFYFYLTHRYNLGFYEEPEDTAQLHDDFIPVTSFIHTLQYSNYERQYISYDMPDDYYLNNYLPGDTIRDKTSYRSIKNTFAISLREGFNKWAKAGLTAFVSHELRSYYLVDTLDSSENQFQRKYQDNVISVGGELSKTQGKALHYRAFGEAVLTGDDAGQFSVTGDIDLNFPLFKDTVQLAANGYIKRQNPTFYFRHYHSKNLWWDNNDMSQIFRTRIEGKLSSKKFDFSLQVGVENIKNYTYFANASQPYYDTDGNLSGYKNSVAALQYSDNIQVFSAILKKNFKLGILHLDTEIAYQKSSNQDILPLPDLSAYGNLYLKFSLAKKVLSVELGADVRYFTSYYAPDYSPTIGQYYLQNPNDLIEIGNYPIVNAYINLHLKHTRIYVMLYHVNESLGNSNYFLAPHYPINPLLFKWGLSWNIFN